MDAFQNVTEVHALALTLARTMTAEELTRTALLFTQLGTTMASGLPETRMTIFPSHSLAQAVAGRSV